MTCHLIAAKTFLFLFLLHPEYSKRVYQGVRVKHTVKDLLAEKRSRQTNVPRYSVSTTYSKPTLLLCPSPSCLSPLHFSPKPNSAATVDILLVAQLRGRLSNLLSYLHFWLLFVCQRSMVDPLTTCTSPWMSKSFSARKILERSQSQSVNSRAQCVYRERHKAQTPMLTSQKKADTMLVKATAVISTASRGAGRGGEVGLGCWWWRTRNIHRQQGAVQEVAYAKLDPCTPASRYCPLSYAGHRQTSYCCLSQTHALAHIHIYTHTTTEREKSGLRLDVCMHKQDRLFIPKPPVNGPLHDSIHCLSSVGIGMSTGH